MADVRAVARAPLAARVVVAGVAVATIGWLGIMERDHVLEARAISLVSKGPAAHSEAKADLRRARFLNPGSNPRMLLAFVYILEHDRAAAARVLTEVVRSEPDNVAAWRLLHGVLPRGTPQAGSAARAFRRLDPIDAPRR